MCAACFQGVWWWLVSREWRERVVWKTIGRTFLLTTALLLFCGNVSIDSSIDPWRSARSCDGYLSRYWTDASTVSYRPSPLKVWTCQPFISTKQGRLFRTSVVATQRASNNAATPTAPRVEKGHDDTFQNDIQVVIYKKYKTSATECSAENHPLSSSLVGLLGREAYRRSTIAWMSRE